MTIETGTHRDRGRRGFTLVEAMLAVVVLAIAAASVLMPFVSGAAVRAEGVRRTLAAELASDLIEQIIRLPFHDPDGANYSPGPDAGETGPATFDNIDDYHNYIEAQGQVRDATGGIFTDPKYANFSRSVVCEYVRVPGESVLVPEKFIRVTVQVNYSGKNAASLRRLVSE